MRLLRFFLPLILAPALCLPCAGAEAAPEEDPDGVTKAVEALPETAAEALQGLEPGGVTLDGGLERLWTYLRGRLSGLLADALAPVAAVLAVSLLCALGQPLDTGQGRFDYVTLAACLAVSAAAVADVKSAVSLGASAMEELGEYAKALLPALAAAALSAGALTSAGAKYAAALLCFDGLLAVGRLVLLPLICGYTALVMVRGALGGDRLNGAIRLLLWASKTLLKWMAVGFAAYLGLTGLVGAGADAAAVKGAKAVLSAALPVVGRTLADAADSLAAGAALVRGSVGLFGLLALGATALLPVARIGLRCLLFKAAAAVAGATGNKRLTALADGIGTAYGLTLSLVATSAAVAFGAVISLMRTVTG